MRSRDAWNGWRGETEDERREWVAAQFNEERKRRMAVERMSGGSSLVDVLDRVLDKGIVIDAYVRVTLVGIELIGVEARIVVASVETYLKYSEQISVLGTVARPAALAPAPDELSRVRLENVELRQRLGELEG
jgi:gas vesicle structural protein